MITTAMILDRGAKYLGNNQDNFIKRIVLAQLLVDARVVRSIEAGMLAFRIWATPGSHDHPVETILDLANEKAKE